MAARQYLVGKYEEYYNALQGEGTAAAVANEYVNEVNTLTNQFESVRDLMNSWSGEAKDSMSTDSLNSVIEKFETAKGNLEEALVPGCEAIDALKGTLEEMKTTEDLWLEKQDALEAKKKSEPSATITENGKSKTNPKHTTWEKEVTALEKEIADLKTKLDGIKGQADASIGKIDSLDASIKEFSDYLNMGGSILEQGDMSQFSGFTLQQRLDYLQGLIDNYQQIYDSLNKLYQEKYGKGFSFSSEDFKQLDFLFDAFDIYWMAKVDRNNLVKGDNGKTVLLDIEKLTQMISYIDTNDVFTKINNYMNGMSWKDSGLDSLYSGDFFNTHSANFLNFNAYNEDRFKQRLKEKYGVTGDAREYLKQNFDNVVNSYKNLLSGYSEYQELTSQIATMKTNIDNVKYAQKLMPYEILMENEDYKAFLQKDYSNYSLLSQEQLQVMSQQEVALYDYLYHNKSKEEADAYLKVMENAMNQRIGAYRATEYIEYLKQNGYGVDDLLKSGWEGCKDGVRNFFDGIADLFRVDSTEAGTKSALDYEMMYKAQFMEELMSDPSYVSQNLDRDTLGFGNITNWYNTGTSIGNMAIPSLVSFIPVVGKPLSTALMTMSIAGNSAVEAKQQGYSTAQAYLYGAISGASETFTEVMMGGIPGVSNLEGKGLFASMLSEGLEEFTQEYLDVGVRWAVLGEQPEFGLAAAKERFNNATQAGVQGMITSGVMQGGNTLLGATANAATKALSPSIGVDPTTGQNIKKYNSFAEFKNSVESDFYVPRAENAINNAMTKVENGETLNFADKLKLNRSLSNVSVEEVANITGTMTETQTQALKDASRGVPKLSSGITEKIDTANTFNQARNATTNLDNVSLTSETLGETVTRDGRSLGEYMADTNPAAVLDTKSRLRIEAADPKAANDIISRAQANQKAMAQAQAQQRTGAQVAQSQQRTTQATNTQTQQTIQTQQTQTTQTTQTLSSETLTQQTGAVQTPVITKQGVTPSVQTQQKAAPAPQTVTQTATQTATPVDTKADTKVAAPVTQTAVQAGTVVDTKVETKTTTPVDVKAETRTTTQTTQKAAQTTAKVDTKATTSTTVDTKVDTKSSTSSTVMPASVSPVTASVTDSIGLSVDNSSSSTTMTSTKDSTKTSTTQETKNTTPTTDSGVAPSMAATGIAAAGPWSYVLEANSNAGKKGTTINVDMSLIDRTITPAANLQIAEANWNAAGRPTSGSVYESFQSAYAYSKMTGNNASETRALHQQPGNINYQTSTFRSDATTTQGTSRADFVAYTNGEISADVVNSHKGIDVNTNTDVNTQTTPVQTNIEVNTQQDVQVDPVQTNTEVNTTQTNEVVNEVGVEEPGVTPVQNTEVGVETPTEVNTTQTNEVVNEVGVEEPGVTPVQNTEVGVETPTEVNTTQTSEVVNEVSVEEPGVTPVQTTTNPTTTQRIDTTERLVESITSQNADVSITQDASGNYTVGEATVSSETMQQHVDNMATMDDVSAQRYVEALANHSELISNPPSDTAIFSDEHCSSILDSFGTDVIKTEEGNYSVRHGDTIISSENMAKTLEIVESLDTKNQAVASEILKSNPSAANSSNIEILTDSNLEVLNNNFGETLFTPQFEQLTSTVSTEQIVNAITSENMTSFLENNRLSNAVTAGVDIFSEHFTSTFTESEISKVAQMLDSRTETGSEYSRYRINDIINSQNDTLLRDVLKLSETIESDSKYSSTYAGIKLTDADLTKSSLYECESVPSQVKQTMILEEAFGEHITVEDASNGTTKLTVDGRAELFDFLSKKSSLYEFIDSHPDMFDDAFKAKYEALSRVDSMLQNFDGSNATQVREALSSMDYYGQTTSMTSEVYQAVSDDYSARIKSSFESLDAPTREVDGVTVYDITTQGFSLLVHTVGGDGKVTQHGDIASQLVQDASSWNSSTGGNPNLSLSLISNQDMVVYGGDSKLILGFSDLSGHSIVSSSLTDSGSSVQSSVTTNNVSFDSQHTTTMSDLLANRAEYVQNAEEAHHAAQWSELITQRYGADGKPIRPTYLVTFGDVDQTTIDAAKALGIDGKPLPILSLNQDAIKAYSSIGMDVHDMSATDVITHFDALTTAQVDFKTLSPEVKQGIIEHAADAPARLLLETMTTESGGDRILTIDSSTSPEVIAKVSQALEVNPNKGTYEVQVDSAATVEALRSSGLSDVMLSFENSDGSRSEITMRQYSKVADAINTANTIDSGDTSVTDAIQTLKDLNPSRKVNIPEALRTELTDARAKVTEYISNTEVTASDIADMSNSDLKTILSLNTKESTYNAVAEALQNPSNTTFKSNVLDAFFSSETIASDANYQEMVTSGLFTADEVVAAYSDTTMDVIKTNSDIVGLMLESDNITNDMISDLLVGENNTLHLSPSYSESAARIDQFINENSDTRYRVDVDLKSMATLSEMKSSVDCYVTDANGNVISVNQNDVIISYKRAITISRLVNSGYYATDAKAAVNAYGMLLSDATNPTNAFLHNINQATTTDMKSVIQNFTASDIATLTNDNIAILLQAGFHTDTSTNFGQNFMDALTKANNRDFRHSVIDVLRANPSVKLTDSQLERFARNLTSIGLARYIDIVEPAVKNNTARTTAVLNSREFIPSNVIERLVMDGNIIKADLNGLNNIGLDRINDMIHNNPTKTFSAQINDGFLGLDPAENLLGYDFVDGHAQVYTSEQVSHFLEDYSAFTRDYINSKGNQTIMLYNYTKMLVKDHVPNFYTNMVESLASKVATNLSGKTISSMDCETILRTLQNGGPNAVRAMNNVLLKIDGNTCNFEKALAYSIESDTVGKYNGLRQSFTDLFLNEKDVTLSKSVTESLIRMTEPTEIIKHFDTMSKSSVDQLRTNDFARQNILNCENATPSTEMVSKLMLSDGNIILNTDVRLSERGAFRLAQAIDAHQGNVTIDLGCSPTNYKVALHTSSDNVSVKVGNTTIGINEFRTDMGRVLEIGQQVSSQTSLSEFQLAVSVDELANLAAKYDTMPSSAFQTAVDALNKVSLSQETVNSLSMSTIQSMLTMDVHKDTLFNYALNGNSEHMLTNLLSPSAYSRTEDVVFGELTRKGLISKGQIAGVDADTISYTTRINPTLLTDEAISRINEVASRYPGTHIALDFANTKGLTTEMITKLDSSILIKVEGSYSSEFLQNYRGSMSGYSGSQFTSNVFTREEAYAILSKLEQIDSRMNPNWTETQKAVFAYDTLKKNITYDHRLCDLEDVIKQKAVQNGNVDHTSYTTDATRSLRGLVSGETICAGYSVIYQEVLTRNGIECYYERGITHDNVFRNESGGGHAWNLVVLDGEVYQCDLTWDAYANSTSKAYEFTRSREAFAAEHRTSVYASIAPGEYYSNISSLTETQIDNISKSVGIGRGTDVVYNAALDSLSRKSGPTFSTGTDALTTTDKYKGLSANTSKTGTNIGSRAENASVRTDTTTSTNTELVERVSPIETSTTSETVDVTTENVVQTTTNVDTASSPVETVTTSPTTTTTQTTTSSEVVTNVEQEIKNYNFKELTQTMLENDYSDMKDITTEFMNSDSVEKTRVAAAVIPAAIQNGDIELIESIKSNLSIEERAKVTELLSSYDSNYVSTFNNINSETFNVSTIEDSISSMTQAELSERIKTESTNPETYNRLKEQLTLLSQSNSTEKTKMVSAMAETLVNNGDTELLSYAKSKLSLQERISTRENLLAINPETAKAFNSINIENDVIDLINSNTSSSIDMISNNDGRLTMDSLWNSDSDITDTITEISEVLRNDITKWNTFENVIKEFGNITALDNSSKLLNVMENVSTLTEINPDYVNRYNELLSKVGLEKSDSLIDIFNDSNYESIYEAFGNNIYKISNGDFVLSVNDKEVTLSSKVINTHAENVLSLGTERRAAYIETLNNNPNLLKLSSNYGVISDTEFNSKAAQAEALIEYGTVDENLRKVFVNFLQDNASTLTPQNVHDSVSVLDSISKSNSLELRNFTSQVAIQILQTSNPTETLQRVQNVFEKNNIPTLGKVYNVVDILHPDFKGFNIDGSTTISPVLKESGRLRRKTVVFTDLVKSFFGSNNRSVNTYLENVEFGSNVFEQIKNNTFNMESLSTAEQASVIEFRDHLTTLYENSLLGKTAESSFVKSDDVSRDIMELAKRISPNGTIDYNIGDRVINMFCGTADIHTLQEAKNYISNKITEAEQRNIAASQSDVVLKPGDLIKGLNNVKYLESILQNGSLSKEYLGSSSDSDFTPLDTDLSMINKDGTIREQLKGLAADGYGPVYAVLTNDSRFTTTRTQNGVVDHNLDMSKYELFYTGVAGKDHYGIRTGFASSDINYFVMENYDTRVGLEIAMNGFYIPVANMDGKIVFTYDDYKELRTKMGGLECYGTKEFTFSPNLTSQATADTKAKILESMSKTDANLEYVKNKIHDVLLSTGIDTIYDGYNTDMTQNSAELYSTGSTARNTCVPGDSDFDYLVKVDREIYFNSDKLNDLKTKTAEQLGLKIDGSGKVTGTLTTETGDVLSIDISFTPRTDKVDISTDSALEERLNAIKEQDPARYEEVLANIVTAKQILKDANAYKSAKSNAKQGGLGGIGIENWVLQHGGSLHDAAVSFLEVADQCETFDEFSEKYRVYDFGKNHYSDKTNSYPHENFVYEVKTNSDGTRTYMKMTPDGYERTKTALRNYLANETIIHTNTNINTTVGNSDIVSTQVDTTTINPTTQTNTVNSPTAIDTKPTSIFGNTSIDETGSLVKDIASKTVEVPSGYNSVAEYRTAAVTELIETGKINDLAPDVFYTLTTMKETKNLVVNTERGKEFFLKNLDLNPNNGALILRSYNSADAEVFNNFLNDPDVKNAINNLSSESKDKVIYTFDDWYKVDSLRDHVIAKAESGISEARNDAGKAYRYMVNELAGKEIITMKNGSFTTDGKYHKVVYTTSDGNTHSFDVRANDYFAQQVNGVKELYSEVGKKNVTSISMIDDTIRNGLLLPTNTIDVVKEVTLEINGKEYSVLTTANDLNYKFKDVTSAEIKNVKEIGNLDTVVEDLSTPVKLSYTVDGVQYEKYIMPVTGEYDTTIKAKINEFVIQNEIKGMENVKVETVSQESFKQNYKSLYHADTRTDTKDVLKSDRYGGNQSDVNTLLVNSYDKVTMTPLQQAQAKLLENLTHKYFPNATDIETVNLSVSYAHGGCFYMAIADTFGSYLSTVPNAETIFKERFGFDLYTEVDGVRSINLEAMVYDMYLSYGSKLFDGDASTLIKSNTDFGISGFNYRDIVINYFNEHGIEVSMPLDNHLAGKDVSEVGNKNFTASTIMNNPNSYFILNSACFDMEQITSNTSLAKQISDGALSDSTMVGNVRKGVGGHAMMITDIDANGDIYVSSWGNKFKILANSTSEYKALGKDALFEVTPISFKVLDAPVSTSISTDVDSQSIERVASPSESVVYHAINDGVTYHTEPVIQTAEEITQTNDTLTTYTTNVGTYATENISVLDLLTANGIVIPNAATRVDSAYVANNPMGLMLDKIDSHLKNDFGLKTKTYNEIHKMLNEYLQQPESTRNIDTLKNNLRNRFVRSGIDVTQAETLANQVSYLAESNINLNVKDVYETSKGLFSGEEKAILDKMVDDYSTRLSNSPITMEEKVAARLYTFKEGSEYYKDLLRGKNPNPETIRKVYKSIYGNMDGYSSIYESADLLTSLIDKSRIDHSVTIYRAAEGFNGHEKRKDISVGQTWNVKDVLSTTGSIEDINQIMDEWKKSHVVLQILAPAGSNVAYIEPYSDIQGFSQNEYLIGPNSKLTVVEVSSENVGSRNDITVVKCILTDSNAKVSTSSVATTRTTPSVPVFKTNTELIDYIKGVNTDQVTVGTQAVRNYIAESVKQYDFSDGKYYSFLEVTNNGVNPDTYSQIIRNVVDTDVELRRAISNGSYEEIKYNLKEKFGIESDEVAKDLQDALLGKDFIDKGTSSSPDWDRAVELLKEPIRKSVVDGSTSGKEPVLWSGFENELHQKMDGKYTTISNTSIGGLNFIESVFTNWKSESMGPKVQDLWKKLSVEFSKACCERIDPNTGKPVESIKFLHKDGTAPDRSFGTLFIESELPQVLGHDNIKKIIFTRTDPDTMAEIGSINVDISDIREYYKEATKGIDIVDEAIYYEIAEKLKTRIKSVMEVSR